MINKITLYTGKSNANQLRIKVHNIKVNFLNCFIDVSVCRIQLESIFLQDIKRSDS